jgi:hypothetical protein
MNAAAEGQGGAKQLEVAERSLSRVATSLERLRPPAEVERAHRDYTAGIRAAASALREATAALRRGDQEEVERLLRLQGRISPDLAARVRDARATFERLGYDLPIESVSS